MALLQRQAGFSLSKLLFGTPTLSSIPQSTTPLVPSIVLPTLTITLPGFLTDIWEGILKAVPKKKTSHMKRRHRQYAGKALKDVQSLNSCPGCGRTKKAHHICPYCWSDMVVGFNKVKNTLLAKKAEPIKAYVPIITKKERARADKWIDVVAESKGKEPAIYRAELAAEERRRKAEENAEIKRQQLEEEYSKKGFFQRLIATKPPPPGSGLIPAEIEQLEQVQPKARKPKPSKPSKPSRSSRSVLKSASPDSSRQSSDRVAKPVYKTRRERRAAMREAQKQTN